MAAGTIEAMMREAAERCGWDDTAVIEVLEDFIGEYADPDDFVKFLRERVQEELGTRSEAPESEGDEEEEL